jgi:hypothetical protein
MISLFSEHAGFKTEYLRRKCFFFFFFLRKKERKGQGGDRPAKQEERRREKTYPITAVKVTGTSAGRARARSP